MKVLLNFLKVLYPAAIFLLLSPTPSYATGPDPQTATDDDIELVRSALNKVFPGKFELTTLTVSEDGSGDKVLAGNISFFKSSNVQFSCVASPASRVLRSMSAVFPAEAKFDLGDIQRNVGPELREVLPFSFFGDAGIKIKDLNVILGDDGKSIKNMDLNLASSSWNFMDFGSLKMQQVALKLTYNPSAAQKISGLVSGEINIGNAKFPVSSNLPKNKADWVITLDYKGESGALKVSDILNAIGGSELGQSIFAVLQGSNFLSNISLPQFSIEAKPAEKQVTVKSNTSAGKVELFINGKPQKAVGYLSYTPAAGTFKFSNISPVLAWLDVIKMPLSNVELVVGNQMMQLRNKPSNPGVGLVSKIDLPKDIHDLLKSQAANIELSGSMSDLSTFELKSNINLDSDLGNDVKMERIGLGLRSKTAEKKFFMDGSISFKVDDKTRLGFKMEVNGDVTSSTFEAGLDLEAINGDGNASEWKEPFGIPCLGILKIGGTVGLNPATLIGSLGLRGDLRLGKMPTGGQPDKRITGTVDMYLDVPKPINSTMAGKLENTTFIRIIEAFEPSLNISGGLRSALSSGVEKLEVDIRPADGYLKLGGDGQIFGKTAHLDLLASKDGKIAASGWLDPITIEIGSLKLLEIKGRENGKLNFNIDLSTDPKINLDGAVSVLGRSVNGIISVSKDGFSAEVEGQLFTGLDMKAVIKGGDFSDKEGMYISLEMRQSFMEIAKTEITNFIKNASGEADKKIREAIDKVEEAKRNKNEVEKFILDIGAGFLSAVNTIQGSVATAGMMIVKGALGTIDIKSIKFEGKATAIEGAVSLKIEMAVMNRPFSFDVSINLNISDATTIAKEIASKIGNTIIDGFTDLGAEFDKVKGALEEFSKGVEKVFKDAIKDIEKAYTEVSKAFGAVAEEFDKFWNGPKYAPPSSTPALTSIAPGIRHYEVYVQSVHCLVADDGFAGGEHIELYGGIMVSVSSGLRAAPGTTGVAWGKNRGDHQSIKAGESFSVNQRKHFYGPANAPANVSIVSKIWEDDGGKHDLSDNPFPGSSQTIDMKTQTTRTTHEWVVVADESGTKSQIKIVFSVYAHPMIESAQVLAAVQSGSINELEHLLRLGGDIAPLGQQPLTEAVNRGHTKMAAYLMGNGYKPTTEHLRTAVNNYNPEMVRRVLLRGATPDAAMLDIAIKKRDVAIAGMMLERGLKANLEQFKWAISQKDYRLAGLIANNGGKPTAAELKTAVDAKDVSATRLILNTGVKADLSMLNSAVTSNNVQFYDLLASSAHPDQSTLKAAMEANNLGIFNKVLAKGIKATDNSILTGAIDRNNTEIVKLVLDNGGNPTSGVQYAVSKKNKSFVVLCLDKGGQGNSAANFAVTTKDAVLTKDLLSKYGASGDVVLSESVTANLLDFAKIALAEGNANPNTQMKKVADENKPDFVNLFLDYNADPNPAMMGMITNVRPVEVKRLIGYGAAVDKPEYVKVASEKKSLDIVTSLVDAGANPDPGMVPAIKDDNVPIISFLLNRGANPKGHIPTPACNNKIVTVKLLLEYGGDANEGIKCATEKGFADITLILLQFGANPKGMLPAPSKQGNLTIVKYLVEFGADPNEGLPSAVSGNHTPVTKHLLESGAIPKGLVATAATHQNLDNVKMLCQYGDDPQPGMQPACDKNQLEMVKVLVGYKADVTPFSYIFVAVDKDYIELINYLIGHGSDPNRANNKGLYLIHIAAGKKNRVATVKALVDGKANLEVKTNKGNTALHLAVIKGNKNLELIEFLVISGADCNATNNKGKSILQKTPGLAKKTRDFLREKGAVAKTGKEEPDNNDKDDDDEVTDEE